MASNKSTIHGILVGGWAVAWRGLGWAWQKLIKYVIITHFTFLLKETLPISWVILTENFISLCFLTKHPLDSENMAFLLIKKILDNSKFKGVWREISANYSKPWNSDWQWRHLTVNYRTMSSYFGWSLLYILGEVIFIFWVKSSSYFGWSRLNILGEVVFIFLMKSSSYFERYHIKIYRYII